ncbi:transposase [Bradyrhizobium sp. LjRoot220]|uniref:transposase n=1 Tax=Bradyrhizobium sp. LjRoot220 TaxID=3342284 RepID=UPI003ECF1149
MATLLAAGADFVIRAGWKSARWLDREGNEFDLVAELRVSARGLIDRLIWIKRKGGAPLALRLVAPRSRQAAAEARRKARRDAQRGGHQISKQTLDAADWVILVTSLKQKDFATADVLALYRLRWRIELRFKRLKADRTEGPPGTDERSARPHVLAHLLTILLLQTLIDELEASPRQKPPGNAWSRRLLQHLVACCAQAVIPQPDELSAPINRALSTPSSRAAKEKTPVSNYAPTILAPMCEPRDDVVRFQFNCQTARGCEFAISRRLIARALPEIPCPLTRGRREDRVRAAPAVPCAVCR